MRADSFLPKGSIGYLLREGWQSSAFLVEGKERTAYAHVPTRRDALLSMVDILGPLSEEQMEDLAKRAPDTFLEQHDILYTPRRAQRGFSSSSRAGSNSTR